MEKNKSQIIITIVIVILLICLGNLYLKNVDLGWQIIHEKSIPDVELINYLSFDSNNLSSGSVTGFVVFDDMEKQPRNLRQYVRITALDHFENGQQLFYLTDIVKMDELPPKYFDPVILTIKNTDGNIITLADSDNNLYLINKFTREVSMFDSTRDVTKLMTKDSNFRDFMKDFLR